MSRSSLVVSRLLRQQSRTSWIWLRRPCFHAHLGGPFVRVARATRFNSTQATEKQQEGADDAQRPAPYPFLWPSFPEPPQESPRTFSPIITANPESWTDRLFIRFLSLLVKYRWLNRSMNWGLLNMLITQREMSLQFIKGAGYAFGEFLARLSGVKKEPWQTLCTDDFAAFLQKKLAAESEREGSTIQLASVDKQGEMRLSMRDCWLWLGKEEDFVLQHGKFGGIQDSGHLRDPTSRTVCIQLPYTAVVQRPKTDGSQRPPPLDFAGESGVRFAVDVEMEGTYAYTYAGETMEVKRLAVVRFASQHFPGQVCRTDAERSARIFKIRNELEWKIWDVDYVYQHEAFADVKDKS